MSEIFDWAVAAADNDAAPPDGAPEGWAPSAVNAVVREIMAAVRRKDADEGGSLTTAGTATAFTVAAPNRTITALAAGMKLKIKIHLACGDSPTLNVSSLGAVALRAENGAALAAGDLQNSAIVEVVYGTTGVPGWFVQGLRKTGVRYTYSTKSDSGAANLVSGTTYKVTSTSPPTLTLPTGTSAGEEIVVFALEGSASFNLQAAAGQYIHWSDFGAALTNGTPRGFGGATSPYHRAVKLVYSGSDVWLGFVYSSFLS